MRNNLVPKLLRSILTGLLLAAAAAGMAAKGGVSTATAGTQTKEVNFNLNPLPENPRQYNLVISDEDEHTISGTFSLDQLQILRAMMVEAEKFALSEEAVGTKESLTTRFMDKQEGAFIVDVQKLGNQSLLFLTFETEIGRTTVDAGRILRSVRRKEGFFFELLSRLQATLPKLPATPSK